MSGDLDFAPESALARNCAFFQYFKASNLMEVTARP